jgi:hypothetical protein
MLSGPVNLETLELPKEPEVKEWSALLQVVQVSSVLT